MLSATSVATLCCLALIAGCSAHAGVPVSISLDQPATVTVVVERADGTRAANLIAETPMAAGKHTFYWDGYDVGLQPDEHSPYVRQRVEPGTYRVRGLVHDGIRMRYEMSLYSPGVTPWKNSDGTGSWLGDHSVNADCLFIPAGSGSPKGAGAQMLFSAATAEAGTAIAWTDLDGRKLGSHAWGWDGAFALARDEGANADKSIYAFALRFGILRAMKTNGSSAEMFKWQPTKPFPAMDDIWGFVDLAVRDQVAVISNSDNRDNLDSTTGNLLVVDLRSGRVLANHITMPTRGLAFGKDGRLYAVVGNAVKRFMLDAGTGALTQEAVVLKNLEAPRRVRFDASGHLYVGVWGASHQVKVFDARMKLLRTIGKPGGAQIGRYDEQRMERPEGMAVDERGQLWIAEGTHVPKRISVWDAASGKFLRAIYGRPQYGAGGHLDPRDKTVFRYPQLVSGSEQAGLEFKLDWATGASRLVKIYFRTPLISRALAQQFGKRDDTVPASASPEFMPQVDAPFRTTWPQTAPPSQAFYVGQHRLLATHGLNRHGYGAVAIVWNADADIIRPVAALGLKWTLFGGGSPFIAGARNFDAVRARTEKAESAIAFVWSDLNGDQQMDAEEFQFITAPKGPVLAGVYFERDLAATVGSLNLGRLPAPRINERGVPVYDATKVERVATQSAISYHGESGAPLVGERDVVLSMWGWEHFTPIQGYRRDGALAWTYRTYSERVAFAQTPGQLIMGYSVGSAVMKPVRGEAGEIWMTGGSKGANYLFTIDGLLLKTLGGDLRVTPLWRFNEAKRGMIVDGVSFEDEAFQVAMQQTDDGEFYVIAGKEHISLCKLEGLETVRRKDWGTIEVTPAMLDGLAPTLVEAPRTQFRNTLDVAVTTRPPIVDGKFDEWSNATNAWAQIDGRTAAALTVTSNRLFAAFRTGDAKLLDNAAPDWRFAFKSGGGLDVLLGTKWDPGRPLDYPAPRATDSRLFITRIAGKPTAILYRPVVPGAPAGERTTFESPIGKEVFDSVRDVSANLQFATDGAGNFEFSLPLSLFTTTPLDRLGLQDHHHDKGQLLIGDLGIIRGDGAQNIQRVYWNNLDTAMTSDTPTEARLKPLNWGVFKLAGAAATNAPPAK